MYDEEIKRELKDQKGTSEIVTEDDDKFSVTNDGSNEGKNMDGEVKENLVNEVDENIGAETVEGVSDKAKDEFIEQDGEVVGQEELDKVKGELSSLTESYARLQAEYANYRRRNQEEKETIGLFANEKIMTDMITVLDNMERALDSFDDKEDPHFKGVDLVYKGLKDALNKYGMKEIEADIGTDFDPNFHMAVMQEQVDGMDAGKIVVVLQKGYILGNKVIRATMVKVSQ